MPIHENILLFEPSGGFWMRNTTSGRYYEHKRRVLSHRDAYKNLFRFVFWHIGLRISDCYVQFMKPISISFYDGESVAGK